MQATIITPTFNAAGFIEACIENAMSQGEVVLEHIIADGGSNDGTVEIVRQLEARYPHLRLLPGPDKGQSDAMNKATSLARGEVVGILNADDFYEPNAVAEAIAVLKRVKRPALVCGDCRILDENGHTLLMNRPKRLSSEALLQDSWMFPIPANPAAYFYMREVHDIVGGYDVADSHAMDCGFLLTCAERVKMIYVPRHWGNFRYIAGCKTFNDDSGPARVTDLINQHKRRLSRSQRLEMRLLMRAKLLSMRVKQRLAQMRLRWPCTRSGNPGRTG